MSILIEALREEINSWLATQSGLLTGERDMQVSLALWLEKSGRFSRVHTEYRVPLAELKARGIPVEPDHKLAKKWIPQLEFPWNNDVSVDIVVENSGRFALVELKYATREINATETLFGESLLTNVSIIKNQAASNIVMYNYWKDVRRIEILARKYANVDGGMALMITNCCDYWNPSRPNAKYAPFSMHEDHTVGPGTLDWINASATNRKDYPQFLLSNAYVCHWEPTSITTLSRNGDPFKAMLSVIEKNKLINT